MAVPGIRGQLWGPCAGLALPGSAGLGHHPGTARAQGHGGTGDPALISLGHHPWLQPLLGHREGLTKKGEIPLRIHSHVLLTSEHLTGEIVPVPSPGSGSWSELVPLWFSGPSSPCCQLGVLEKCSKCIWCSTAKCHLCWRPN